MTSSSPEAPGQVGTEPTDEVLRKAGIAVTEAGKAHWREALSRPIPAEALEEGRQERAAVRARVRGHAAA